MELRNLRYFLEISVLGNMTAAAESLNVSQSALSKSLKDLETEVGKTLFMRTGHRMVLTKEGQLLQKRAEDILRLVSKTKDEFRNMQGMSLEGDIYIGTYETSSLSYITDAIKPITNRYPKIRFHFRNGNAPWVIQGLESGVLDFGLAFDPVSKDGFNSYQLPQENIGGILARKDSALAENKTIRFCDLIGLPLLGTTRRHSEKPILDHFMGADSERLNYVGSFDTYGQATLLVEAGIGYAPIIDNGKTEFRNLTFIPFEGPIKVPLFLIWKKYQEADTIKALFLNEIMAQCNAAGKSVGKKP